MPHGPFGIYCVAYNGSIFVALGGGGAVGPPGSDNGNTVILTSSNGANWVAHDASAINANVDLRSVVWGKNLFVAVGQYGVFTSPDGIIWTQRDPGVTLTNAVLTAVAWNGSQFVAVGGTTGLALITTSSNGINWTRRDTGGVNNMYRDITWSDSRFVAVGYNGIVSVSPPQSTVAPPPKPILSSPAQRANEAGTLVTFRWNAAPRAENYRLRIVKVSDGSVFYNRLVGNRTSFTGPNFANDGERYRWHVRAFGGGEWSAFSDPRVFTNGRATVNSFNSDFGSLNRDGYAGWVRTPQANWSLSATAMVSTGRPGYWNNAHFPYSGFDNFEYEAQVRRVGSITNGNAIIIRAGNNYKNDNHSRYPSYYFGYNNSGRYVISKYLADGSGQTIQTWTESAAIRPDDINRLKIRAVGSTMHFYINDTLVRTISDNSLSSGLVGVAAYTSDNAPANDRFLVFWARLTSLPDSTVLSYEEVSPEQEALNRKANESFNEETFSLEGDFNH